LRGSRARAGRSRGAERGGRAANDGVQGTAMTGIGRTLGVLCAALAWSSTAGAQAEKISAINTDKGRIIFRNDASFIGIGIGAPTATIGFATGSLQRAHFDPQFAIAPSIDVLIIPNLSVGGTIGFTFNKFNVGIA